MPEAIESGFHAFFDVNTPEPLTVLLKLKNGSVLKELNAGDIEPNNSLIDKPMITELCDRLQTFAILGKIDPKDPVYGAADSYWQIAANNVPDKLKELMADKSVPAIVAFGHSMGGGAESVLQQIQHAALDSSKRFFIIRFDLKNLAYTCESLIEGEVRKGEFHSVEEILNSIYGIEEVLVSELADYGNIPELLDYISKFTAENKIKKSFILFDFISVCPSIHLMDYTGRFCQFPNDSACKKCFDIIKGEGAAAAIFSGRDEYRNYWKKFLLSCDIIYSLSDYTKQIIESIYPELIEKNSIIIKEPKVDYLPSKLERNSRHTKDLVIGTLGVLYPIKGQNIIADIAELSQDQSNNFQLRIIGYCADKDEELTKFETGKYNPKDLVEIVKANDIDIFFISSICPETYSLTVSELIAMDMPFACFDIGAPAERAKSYAKGITVPYDSSAKEIVEALRLFAFETLKLDELPVVHSCSDDPVEV